MIENRLSLTRLEAFAESDIVVPKIVSGHDLDLRSYSRFKYGGGAQAIEMGRLLADRFIETVECDGRDLWVSSSGYKVAPPAARSLQGPFVSRLRESLKAKQISEFRIDRANLTDGDYATKPLEERIAIMRNNGLSIAGSPDLHGQEVVVLDDIRVTGSHESMISELLRLSGVGIVHHVYLIDVVNGTEYPQVEAAINAMGFEGISHTLLDVATSDDFIPNARFCKAAVQCPPEDQDILISQVSTGDLQRIIQYIRGDSLVGSDYFVRKANDELNNRSSEKITEQKI